jgi:HAD superfamily hydrolase (TIGR01549 family)
MLKALIFDLDDTLVNSSPLHKKAFGIALKKYNVDINSISKDEEKNLMGRTLSDVAQRLIKHFSVDISVQTLIVEREKAIIRLLANVKTMPGFPALKKFLIKTKLKKAVATSTYKRYADIVLKKINFQNIFQIIVTADQITRSKPDPQIFLLAAKKLRIKPKDCVVIEDADNGILAAKAAGMKVIAVKNSKFDTHQNLKKADFIVNNLSEIEKKLINL